MLDLIQKLRGKYVAAFGVIACTTAQSFFVKLLASWLSKPSGLPATFSNHCSVPTNISAVLNTMTSSNGKSLMSLLNTARGSIIKLLSSEMTSLILRLAFFTAELSAYLLRG